MATHSSSATRPVSQRGTGQTVQTKSEFKLTCALAAYGLHISKIAWA